MDKIFQLYNWRNGVNKIKASLKKDDNAIRFGILGAAQINFPAIIDPIQTHPGATLNALAARDRSRAEAQIAKYNLGPACKAYGSYDELLADKDIDAVYIPLPNGLHCEWAIKAMESGKDVLLEKPLVSNAEQARKVRESASKTGKVLLEAFHWRFHPAAHLVKSIIESGKYGSLQSINSYMSVPGGFVKPGDIRLNYDLAGGACMDLTYIFSTCTYFACPTAEFANSKITFHQAVPRLNEADKRVDEAMECKFSLEQEGKPAVDCQAQGTLTHSPLLGFIPRLTAFAATIKIGLEKADIVYDGFVAASVGHSITITEKDSGKKETEKLFVDGPQWGARGKPWWTTYRFQLEAFVDQIQAKAAGDDYKGPWMSLDESVKLMEVIDGAYDKAGLPRRGT